MRYLILCLLLVFPGLALPEASPQASSRPILVLGDSLSAAYHIAPESGWVTLLDQRLQQQTPQRRYRVVNASISGETTAGGLARLPKLLAENAPALVLVELGANDGLRGLAIEEIHANLQRILKACRDAGAKIVLIGIELPINYGPQYRDGLRNMYRDIAREFNVPLVPFLLEGVATDPKLMQDDGLHPLAAAEPRVLETVWPVLAPVLKELP
jgi:acyl-CoA thioesterase-1